MSSIKRLIPDIYSLIQDKKSGWFTDELARTLSIHLADRLQGQLGTTTYKPMLRLSQMGQRCPCALWYSIHHPELAEALPSWAEIKYSFGHVVECLTICLAKAAGHEVTGEQDELELDGVMGHRDCVIDGCTVDIKSASSFAFAKFKTKDFSYSDSFGYLDQLDGYTMAAYNDPLVTIKDKAYILAVDKQLGHMHLYEHEVTGERQKILSERIMQYKSIIEQHRPPACSCGTRPEGGAGNIRLDVKASYSPFKFCCHPGLRTFLYASGPVFLTKVVRVPDVKEIDRYGKTVYS